MTPLETALVVSLLVNLFAFLGLAALWNDRYAQGWRDGMKDRREMLGDAYGPPPSRETPHA